MKDYLQPTIEFVYLSADVVTTSVEFSNTDAQEDFFME